MELRLDGFSSKIKPLRVKSKLYSEKETSPGFKRQKIYIINICFKKRVQIKIVEKLILVLVIGNESTGCKNAPNFY